MDMPTPKASALGGGVVKGKVTAASSRENERNGIVDHDALLFGFTQEDTTPAYKIKSLKRKQMLQVKTTKQPHIFLYCLFHRPKRNN
jgi:hypothetical protein